MVNRYFYHNKWKSFKELFHCYFKFKTHKCSRQALTNNYFYHYIYWLAPSEDLFHILINNIMYVSSLHISSKICLINTWQPHPFSFQHGWLVYFYLWLNLEQIHYYETIQYTKNPHQLLSSFSENWSKQARLWAS